MMGKCIVITGAAMGLGRALARRFANDDNTIILMGRTRATLDTLASELGPRSVAIVCDVGNADSVRTGFATIAQHHPTIDVLINNAAVYQPSFVKDVTDEQVSTAIMTNFAGPVYCSRAAIPMMRRGSHIINISSETVGLPYAMFSMYQSSKAGLERFTEALHAELAPDGIRVTLVRAGGMSDADSKSPVSGELARKFVEENTKRGIDLRQRPVSSFTSVADVLNVLINLPGDVNIPSMILEARHS